MASRRSIVAEIKKKICTRLGNNMVIIISVLRLNGVVPVNYSPEGTAEIDFLVKKPKSSQESFVTVFFLLFTSTGQTISNIIYPLID